MMSPPFSACRRMRLAARLAMLVFIAAVLFPFAAQAAPGDVVAEFNPGIGLEKEDEDAGVYAAALRPDGRIYIGGEFISVGGLARKNLALLNADGTVNESFNTPVEGGLVRAIAVQDDGRVLLAGSFTTIGGTAVPGLVRLLPNGAVDTSFSASGLNGYFLCIALQSDGKILLGGAFTAGAAPGLIRRSIVRLEQNGALDSGFDAGLVRVGDSDPVIWSINPVDHGILVSGAWVKTPGAADDQAAVLLNENGSAKGSFIPDADILIGQGATSWQRSGKLLIAGQRNSGDYFSRVNPDGSLDSGFNPNVFGFIFNILPQADGRILIGGSFGGVGGEASYKLARLQHDGVKDPAFNAAAGSIDPDDYPPRVRAMCLLPGGRILVGGYFSGINGSPSPHCALLENDAAPETLSIIGSSKVEWLRGGTCQSEARAAKFEITTGGSAWTPLGTGTAIEGGWELTGVSLPASGEVRARVRVSNGTSATWNLEKRAAFGGAAPISNAALADGTPLISGVAQIDFGSLNTQNISAPVLFTIRNAGSASLELGPFEKGGGQPEDFLVDTSASALLLSPGEQTSISLRFKPQGSGNRQSTLKIHSNEGGASPFEITLKGTGIASSEAGLASLAVSAGALTPAFAPAVTAYSLNVPYLTNALTITAASVHPGAVITINGEPPGSGQVNLPVDLPVGNSTVTLSVTAEDGITQRTWNIAVTRAAGVPGDLDPDFNPLLRYEPFSPVQVDALAIQPDGGLFFGGRFYYVNETFRNGLARLLPDAEMDNLYVPESAGTVECMAIQPDGKLIVAGYVSTVGPVSRTNLVRLNKDGTVDASFNADTNSNVHCILVQPDGKIVIGGQFSFVRGVLRNRIARLNSDGSVETAFNPNAGNAPGVQVNSIVRQSDGMLLLGGTFTTIGGTTRNRLARLTAAGALDTGYNPNVLGTEVYCIALQADGKAVIGGWFNTVGGFTRNYMARLTTTGTVDTGFNPNFNGRVYSAVVQTDGTILAGGPFFNAGGAQHIHLVRLSAAGAVDAAFNTASTFDTTGLALQADGKILACGQFNAINEVPRKGIARIENHPAASALSIAGSTAVQWLRSGASPETTAVSFELSTDSGSAWQPLGEGTRIAGGWQLSGLNLPVAGILRATARTQGGFRNGSGGLVQSLMSFGPNHLELWRIAHFGSAANAGNAANDFDFDGDGLTNIVEYAWDLDPASGASNQIPQGSVAGNNWTVEFAAPHGVTALTYGAEWSSSLQADSWTAIPDSGAGSVHRFTVPVPATGRLFLRLKVTTP